jgi:hypothetical protein
MVAFAGVDEANGNSFIISYFGSTVNGAFSCRMYVAWGRVKFRVF